ncbi:MAG TPA: Grx4 family monothiol glutaredoxin [Polyangiaceae bacterium]|nr:Grx4 family monothiol glutaredoxin [Polyangiaceae bacterium]
MSNLADGSNPTHEHISQVLRENRVVLFMKGNRHFPQCGFSAQVVNILDEFLPTYKTVNVLSDPALRDGIKAYSNWPTIPQLYVDGKFVGGCDIVRDMHGSGELAALLSEGASSGGSPVTPEAPKVHLSPAAVGAFKQALGEGASEHPRLHIPANFEHELFIDEKQPDDLEVQADGLVLLLDPASARRANGVRIDYVTGTGQGGFKIDNPNSPPRVQPLSVKGLKGMLDRGDTFELVDVRTPEERATARIAAARHLDDEGFEYLQGLPKDTPIVFHCHHGMRSRAAAERFLSTGFTRVFNLEGGIDAWSNEIDPTVPRY